MADDGADGPAVAAVVHEILAAIPAGCSWLLPVRDAAGAVVDYEVAATSSEVHDIYGRGVERR